MKHDDEDVFHMTKGDNRHMMSRARLRTIKQMAEHCTERKARELYEELYGALAAASVPEHRVRESLVEACNELLDIDVE